MGAKTLVTVEQLERLPETGDVSYELDQGELVEVSSASLLHNYMRDRLVHRLMTHLDARIESGHVVSEQWFRLSADTVRSPDVAFIAPSQRGLMDFERPIQPFSPALAIEITSPSNTFDELARKTRQYLDAGSHAVWIFVTAMREIHVYSAASHPAILAAGDLLEDAALLPGFSAPRGGVIRSLIRLSHAFSAQHSSCAPVSFAQKRPFDVETLLRIQRIGEPALSPDGKLVAYTVATPDLSNNKLAVQTDLRGPCGNGGAPRLLTHDGDDNQRPRWSPDSKQIYFISEPQRIVAGLGDGRRRLQARAWSPASRPKPAACWSRPTERRSCSSRTSIPECGADDEACNQRNLDCRRQGALESAHLHVSALSPLDRMADPAPPASAGGESPTAPDIKDLTPGQYDVPPFSLGGPDGYAISPDSLELAFVVNTRPRARHQHQLRYLHGSARRRRRPENHHSVPGADDGPLYSPDGKYLAFRSQPRAGYESDRWRLMVLERATGKTTQSHRDARPLGRQLHLVARFDAPVLHHRGSRPHRPADDRGHRRRLCAASSAANRASTTCSSPPTAAP